MLHIALAHLLNFSFFLSCDNYDTGFNIPSLKSKEERCSSMNTIELADLT